MSIRNTSEPTIENDIVSKIIPEKLKEIEKKEQIKILHCVESGSRAWGFPSPDSDYDVRFIYVHQKDYYLRLDKTRDVIEWQLDDTLDINGWDLQKALRLLHNSNPTMFEWKNSPIVYKTTADWEKVSDIMKLYFNEKASLYHYLSTAKSNYREYLQGDNVRLKKYFYVLRPILACRWILEKKCPPPMLFSELIKECLQDELIPVVDRLLEMKSKTSELGEGKRIDELNAYLDNSILEIDSILKDYPNKQKCSWEELNNVFLKLL